MFTNLFQNLNNGTVQLCHRLTNRYRISPSIDFLTGTEFDVVEAFYQILNFAQYWPSNRYRILRSIGFLTGTEFFAVLPF
jgi:hypothetical protein